VVADSWTAESRITAAITAMAKEAQHAARKLRIVALQIAVVLSHGGPIRPPGPAVPSKRNGSAHYPAFAASFLGDGTLIDDRRVAFFAVDVLTRAFAGPVLSRASANDQPSRIVAVLSRSTRKMF
jgi:hypothetical protein